MNSWWVCFKLLRLACGLSLVPYSEFTGAEMPHHPTPKMKNFTTDLEKIENSLFNIRCYLNSMQAAETRMGRQLATCRKIAGDAMALLEEATD
jgi:hypothetical protein